MGDAGSPATPQDRPLEREPASHLPCWKAGYCLSCEALLLRIQCQAVDKCLHWNFSKDYPETLFPRLSGCTVGVDGGWGE